MANRFFRRPVEGSDENSWAQYNDAHILEAIGECNVKLYNDAGALKVSKGRIGINDGTHEGVCIIDTVTTISLVPVTNNNWAEIYMTVSGPNVTFTAVNTNTGVDIYWYSLPSTFIAGFDQTKGGYYINAARRCIGLIKLDASGNLESIINVLNNEEGYNGYSFYDNNEEIKLLWRTTKDIYKNWGEFEIGDWDMLATETINVAHHLDNTKIRTVNGIIRNDADTIYYPITPQGDVVGSAPANDINVSIQSCSSTNIKLSRRDAAAHFKSVNFDSTSYNRGWLYIELGE